MTTHTKPSRKGCYNSIPVSSTSLANTEAAVGRIAIRATSLHEQSLSMKPQHLETENINHYNLSLDLWKLEDLPPMSLHQRLHRNHEESTFRSIERIR